MPDEIKKLLSIRVLREEKAQKYYEQQQHLLRLAHDKKAAQTELIEKLQTDKLHAHLAFEQFMLQNTLDMSLIRQSQIEQALAQTHIEAAQQQLVRIEIEIDALNTAVQDAYTAYMASIKGKQKIETVLKEETLKMSLEASKEEDKKLEEIAEVLAVRH